MAHSWLHGLIEMTKTIENGGVEGISQFSSIDSQSRKLPLSNYVRRERSPEDVEDRRAQLRPRGWYDHD